MRTLKNCASTCSISRIVRLFAAAWPTKPWVRVTSRSPTNRPSAGSRAVASASNMKSRNAPYVNVNEASSSWASDKWWRTRKSSTSAPPARSRSITWRTTSGSAGTGIQGFFQDRPRILHQIYPKSRGRDLGVKYIFRKNTGCVFRKSRLKNQYTA